MNSTHASSARSFAEVARGFCSWCEGPSLGAEPEVTAAAWLAKLHAAALVLPDVESQNSDDLPDIPPASQEAARNNIACFMGMYYRQCFDPDPILNEEPVMGDVGDDLLDTYQDVRCGLLLFDGEQPTEALWQWSFLHRVHWGRHAVGAMVALHCLSISKRK